MINTTYNTNADADALSHYCDVISRNAATQCKGEHQRPSNGTIAATPPVGPVPQKHPSEAVAAPTESGALSRPDSAAGLHSCMAAPNGFGRGASIRKDGGTASDVFLTPLPPYAHKNADGGFPTPEGERAMKPTATTQTTQTTTFAAPASTQATQPQTLEEALKTINDLRNTICNIDSLADSELNEVAAMARTLALAFESPNAHGIGFVNTCYVLSAIRSKCQMLASSINCDAHDAGAADPGEEFGDSARRFDALRKCEAGREAMRQRHAANGTPTFTAGAV